MTLISIASAFALSFVLTALMRRYAISARLLDHPNARSSHSIPTPRGGGVGVVIAFIAFVAVSGCFGSMSRQVVLALLGSGGVVAAVGFLDDRGHVPARWRFLSHLLAGIWGLYWLGGIPPVPIFGHSIDLGWPGLILAVTYIVWMVNLYNFMDGIDGIAGIEAITVSLGGALTWWLATGTTDWTVPVVFAACVAGFLIWNYPPARIFMGDSGSGFVGLVLAMFSLWAGGQIPLLFWCWFILLGTFMVDATTTLVRRVRRGERFSEAHRSHGYQYAARKHRSHRTVALAFGAINILWLLPVAVLVAMGKVDGVVGVIVAYAPLITLAFHYKAGVRHAQET